MSSRFKLKLRSYLGARLARINLLTINFGLCVGSARMRVLHPPRIDVIFLRLSFVFATICATVACEKRVELARRATPEASLIVDCAAVKKMRPVVIITAGQSNAANHGQAKTQPKSMVFSLYDGKCYKAFDPQPGASGTGGSPWPALGDLLVEKRIAPSVLFISCAITSTTVAQWTTDASLLGCVERGIASLTALGLSTSLVLWHQGEADARDQTSAKRYDRDLEVVISRFKALTSNAPLIVSQTSICRSEANATIRGVQASHWNTAAKVFPGPDTDQLGLNFRHDGCHFSPSGLLAVAYIWYQSIRKAGVLIAP